MEMNSLCTSAAAIVVEALREGVRELRHLSWSQKGVGDIVTSADHAASARARGLASKLLSGFLYADEESSDSPEAAARLCATHERVALGDPIDGSRACLKVAERRAWLGQDSTPADWIDQYASTLALFESGRVVASAIATARGHAFVSDGVTLFHSGFEMEGSKTLSPAAITARRPEANSGLGIVGAIENIPASVLETERRRYHLQRLGHFATDLVEVLSGNASAFISGREMIWDYAVAIPIVSATDGLRILDLDGRPIGTPAPATTSVRIEWIDA